MDERFIHSPLDATPEDIERLEKALEQPLHPSTRQKIESFIEDYDRGRDRLMEQFLEENPGFTEDDWRTFPKRKIVPIPDPFGDRKTSDSSGAGPDGSTGGRGDSDVTRPGHRRRGARIDTEGLMRGLDEMSGQFRALGGLVSGIGGSFRGAAGNFEETLSDLNAAVAGLEDAVVRPHLRV